MVELRRLFVIALFAGLAGAIVASGVQMARLWPLILQAETYEAAAAAAPHAPGMPDAHAHGAAAAAAEAPEAPSAEAWSPADGAERIGYTLIFNLIAALAFALLLNGAMSLRYGDFVPSIADGVAWGLAGFAAFSLAPAFGLPPELPGMHAAELGARQLWWLATAAATAGGLGLAAFGRRPPLRVLGLALIAMPHVIGAPRGGELGNVPGEIAAEFAAASLVGALLLWLVLGVTSVLARRWLTVPRAA
jgi:cobalt transporter subunit CbtA